MSTVSPPPFAWLRRLVCIITGGHTCRARYSYYVGPKGARSNAYSPETPIGVEPVLECTYCGATWT